MCTTGSHQVASNDHLWDFWWVLLGAVIGWGVTKLTAFVSRRRVREKCRKNFEGDWEREDMNEYSVKPEDRKKTFSTCYNQKIRIDVVHTRSLKIQAEFGKFSWWVFSAISQWFRASLTSSPPPSSSDRSSTPWLLPPAPQKRSVKV